MSKSPIAHTPTDPLDTAELPAAVACCATEALKLEEGGRWDWRRISPSFLWILVVWLGIVAAWTTRYDINQDGISYVELASAYVHHAWSEAISAYWNPLYPGTLAPALAALRGTGETDFAVAHAVNFLIFLFALLCFRFFYGEVLRRNRILWPASLLSQVTPWVAELIGCALFLSCALDLISLTLVTPDLLMAGLVFAAMGLVVRMQNASGALLSFALLGCVLALGYFAKPVMLIFWLAVAVTMLVCARTTGWRLRSVAAMCLTFAFLTGPYIYLISKGKRRFTISDNGALTYLFVVDKLPYGYPHGIRSSVLPTLKHPPRMLYSSPATYEFVGPVPGSCPIWYDPSYWYDGAKVRFSLRNQIQQLAKNARTFVRIVSVKQAPLCMAVLAVFLALSSPRAFGKALAEQPILLIPSVFVLALICLFNLESRLIAPFLTVLWICVLSALRPFVSGSRMWMQALAISGSCLLCISVVSQVGTDAANAQRNVSTESYHATEVDRLVARGLHRAGIEPDAKVAFVGDSISAYWAHLARVRIIAEIPTEEAAKFSNSNEQTMSLLLAKLSAAGIKALVSPIRPAVATEGWQLIPGTGYYVHLLN